MDIKKSYFSCFGVGPTGIAVTVVIWVIFYTVEEIVNIPPMLIHPVLRFILLLMFLIDAAYLVVGGLYTLAKNNWGQKLITTGPFLFVRHPLYSALIYSATGALALSLYSWSLLVAAVPLSFYWSWLVTKEERFLKKVFGEEYERYCATTGQFFPSFKNIEDKFS